MFTGIVEESGTVQLIKPGEDSCQLLIQAKACARGLKIGDSLAVNGCCLTVVKVSTRANKRLLQFDLLKETWNRTNLQFANPGSKVNLERSLRADGRFGGHFVTGHIDGLGKITSWEREGKDYRLQVAAAPELMRYIIKKGSIAVDGVSLTVANVQKNNFDVWIIPHTFKLTTFGQREIGDAVNLEVDLIGKYVERLLTCRQAVN